jgi:hypothetical protein
MTMNAALQQSASATSVASNGPNLPGTVSQQPPLIQPPYQAPYQSDYATYGSASANSNTNTYEAPVNTQLLSTTSAGPNKQGTKRTGKPLDATNKILLVTLAANLALFAVFVTMMLLDASDKASRQPSERVGTPEWIKHQNSESDAAEAYAHEKNEVAQNTKHGFNIHGEATLETLLEHLPARLKQGETALSEAGRIFTRPHDVAAFNLARKDADIGEIEQDAKKYGGVKPQDFVNEVHSFKRSLDILDKDSKSALDLGAAQERHFNESFSLAERPGVKMVPHMMRFGKVEEMVDTAEVQPHPEATEKEVDVRHPGSGYLLAAKKGKPADYYIDFSPRLGLQVPLMYRVAHADSAVEHPVGLVDIRRQRAIAANEFSSARTEVGFEKTLTKYALTESRLRSALRETGNEDKTKIIRSELKDKTKLVPWDRMMRYYKGYKGEFNPSAGKRAMLRPASRVKIMWDGMKYTFRHPWVVGAKGTRTLHTNVSAGILVSALIAAISLYYLDKCSHSSSTPAKQS